MSGSRQQAEPPPATDVLGLPVRPLRAEELIELVIHRARMRISTTVCYANAHTANLACRDPAYRAALGGSDILYADGASVVWASRLRGRPLPERMTAADFFPRFAERCAAEGLSLYLLGGRHGVAERAAMRLGARLAGLKVAGVSHGYFDDAISPAVVAEVNGSGADVLLVGMSSPRQEFWVTRHAHAFAVPVRWCVGALFDYLAGAEQRAPAWLCRLGGEWLFRLGMDPAGKWRRYLIGNPRFVCNWLRWWMRRSGGEQADVLSPGASIPVVRGDGVQGARLGSDGAGGFH